MLKISDFSKLTRVPTATLRYYDDRGLLKPAQVDRFTEYRFYTLDQLPRLVQTGYLAKPDTPASGAGRKTDAASHPVKAS